MGTSPVTRRVIHEPNIRTLILKAEQPECVINFSAFACAISWTDSDRRHVTSVVVLARITECIRNRPWFRHWMQIGSSEVYGLAKTRTCVEGAPANPTRPYAVSRLTGDYRLKIYRDGVGFPVSMIRPSNALGLGRQFFWVMPGAGHCTLTGERFPLEVGDVAGISFTHTQRRTLGTGSTELKSNANLAGHHGSRSRTALAR